MSWIAIDLSKCLSSMRHYLNKYYLLSTVTLKQISMQLGTKLKTFFQRNVFEHAFRKQYAVLIRHQYIKMVTT